jgi:formate-dependent nitrite reductase membrane component NrfD
MTHEEKRSWIMLAVSVIAYSAYVGIVLSRSDGQPLASTGYVTPLLCTIGAAIGATILLDIAVDIASPRTTREKEIGRFGESMGQAFIVIGAVAALLMALAEWDWFWIANVIYLCFVLSAVLSSTAKIVAYRGGLPQW